MAKFDKLVARNALVVYGQIPSLNRTTANGLVEAMTEDQLKRIILATPEEVKKIAQELMKGPAVAPEVTEEVTSTEPPEEVSQDPEPPVSLD